MHSLLGGNRVKQGQISMLHCLQQIAGLSLKAELKPKSSQYS